MNLILRNIIAVIIGLLVGGTVNMGIINISTAVIPFPPGVDLSTMESMEATMHLF